MNNKFLLIVFLIILLISYPVYADTFQDISNFFSSIFSSIMSFFNNISNTLFGSPPAVGDGGGGGAPGGGSSTPSSCSASISILSIGKDTCSVTATITTSYCDNKTYSIKNSEEKCSGSISGNTSTIDCYWTVTVGTYTYKLYINNALKTSKSVTCSATPPPICSDGTLYGQCSSTKPKFCDGYGNLADRCDLCGCPSGKSCNATTGLCYIPLKCSDNTLYSSCSGTKPKYCENGNLIDKCSQCGCPSGQSCNTTTGSCYTPTSKCSDGTLYGQCSLTKPKYCENGNLVNKCSLCNCISGLSCNASTGLCYSTQNLTAWYGIGDTYKLVFDYASNPDFLNDWETLLTQTDFTQWGFNTIRLDFKFASMGANPLFADDLPLVYTDFAAIARKIISKGYNIVAEDHSWQNFGSSAWMNEWTNFVTWLNQPAQQDIRDHIVCYSLRSEPGEWTYEQGPWWNGLYMPNRSSPPVGWNWAGMVTATYAELTRRIRTIQPTSVATNNITLVAWADPSAYYAVDGYGPFVRPADEMDGIVYEYHVWSNDADNKGHSEPNSMTNWMTEPCMNPVNYPNSRLWVGEFGSWWLTSSGEGVCTQAGQKYTFTSGTNSLMQWCLAKNVGFSIEMWWHWNHDPNPVTAGNSNAIFDPDGTDPSNTLHIPYPKFYEYSDWLQTVGFPKNA